MTQRHRHRIRIYKKRSHLLVTILFLLLPLVFLVVFSNLAALNTVGLFEDLGISTVRLAIAYVFSAILAWVFAVSFYHGKRADIALPVFDVLQSFPTFAALPVGTMLLGKGNVTVIFFLMITIIWPLFFTLVSSLKLVRSDWEEVVKMTELKGWNYVRLYVWPITKPGLITGSIIGLGEGWEALVATEMIVGNKNGLGIFFQAHSADIGVTAFGIVGLLLFIFVINKILWIPLLDASHRSLES